MEKVLPTKNIQEKNDAFELNGTTHVAYVAFDSTVQGKRPGIIVVPEWWGLNEYARKRTRMLAGLGYVAMAIDVFGNGAIGHNPQEAMELIKPYNDDPSLSKKIIDTAIEKFKTYPQLDEDKIALIGYCFGGSVVLNAAKLGADVKGVVGFHPSLEGAQPDEDEIKSKFLICHGEDDAFENDNVNDFKKEMDAAGVDYIFKTYPDAKHAFTNPNSAENAEKFGIPVGYNADADSNSWEDMKSFLKEIFQ